MKKDEQQSLCECGHREEEHICAGIQCARLRCECKRFTPIQPAPQDGETVEKCPKCEMLGDAAPCDECHYLAGEMMQYADELDACACAGARIVDFVPVIEKIKGGGDWISVDTRLPPEDGEYLTYAEKVGGWPKYRVNYFQVDVPPRSTHWHWDEDYVVAWMPITPFEKAVKQEESWLGKAVRKARGGDASVKSRRFA